jgi:hypothetical protein
MGFTIPSSYPAPLPYSGVPDKIRSITMSQLLERDRFIFANQRRMLTSLSPFWTTNTLAFDAAAVVQVHNSKLTENSITAVAFGYNANVTVTVNSVTSTQALGPAPSFFTTTFSPTWTDDTWVTVIVGVQSLGGTGGFYGLYILEDPLTAGSLP